MATTSFIPAINAQASVTPASSSGGASPGSAIGVERLQARPVTTLCIQCKSEQEAAERRSKFA